MEATTIINPPVPTLDPAPPTSPATNSKVGEIKKPPKLIYLLGGVALILVSLAIGIAFFGNKRTQLTSTKTTSNGTILVDTSAWEKYTNTPYFYEISVPPKWEEIRHSPLRPDITLFNAEDTAILEITVQKSLLSLDEYLGSQDEAYKNTVRSTGTTQVKVGSYDGYERAESWPTVGLQSIATYVKVQDWLYTFTLSPAMGKNAVTNESIIRSYHSALASFRLTDTSQLGVDLKEYTSKKVEGLAFQAFSIKYPQTWVLTEKIADNSLDVSIYRNNYELTISQKAIGGAVCLFSDSPAFEGSSGDLRSKQFAELNTVSGTILRRYFNVNTGDKSSMFFCEKQANGPYFQTPLTIGGLVYNVPAKYDADIIKEMDEIVKSISPVAATPSSYSCPESGWVSCMPILSEEGKRLCSPDAMKWYKDNCPGFKGAAL